ncbi:MAG: 50S ribosomal protein L24 [Chloroflexota bacterium]|nr:MAG: 50S ribosomal protein L24 [Chloroflexota bacterium]
MASRIRSGDNVVILAGKDRGKSGRVRKVLRDDNRVFIEGANLVKRHQKARPGVPGGIIEKEASIHVSNVALADPSDGKPTRVGFRIDADGVKVRVAKKSGQDIPTPKPDKS